MIYWFRLITGALHWLDMSCVILHISKEMENYINHVWNFVSKPQVLCHDDGYYIFKFATLAYRDLVMHTGPYTYRSRSFIMRNWTLDFEFNHEFLNKILLWVKLLSLPLGSWYTDSLSKLASVVGRPMYTDKNTTVMERISFARVLVEADIFHTLPTQMELSTPIGTIQ